MELRHRLQQDDWHGIINSLNFRYILRKLFVCQGNVQTFFEPQISLAMTTIRVNKFSVKFTEFRTINRVQMMANRLSFMPFRTKLIDFE